MTKADILITGATGTTGGALLGHLTGAGVKVRALVRDSEKAAPLAGDLVELVEGDLNDAASLAPALDGIRAAYLNILPSPDALTQVDNFLAAARDAGVAHVIKLSGLNATPESRSALIRIHAAADAKVAASGLGHTILRANSFYQNILSQLDGIRANGQFFLPLGEARQSLVDVTDIAAVAAAILTDPAPESSVRDLTGPDALTFHDVAAALGRALGREVSYVAISNDAFRDSLLDAGLPEAAAANVAELFSVFAEGTYAYVTGDVEKALGRPARSIDDFAATLAA